MSKLKRVATLFGASAAAVTLALAIAAPASAGASGQAWSVAGDGYSANACDLQFNNVGDHFYLDDNRVDGIGCYGEWYRDDTGTSGHMWNQKGGDSSVDFNENFAEGAWVQFWVCGEKGGAILEDTCSARSLGQA